MVVAEEMIKYFFTNSDSASTTACLLAASPICLFLSARRDLCRGQGWKRRRVALARRRGGSRSDGKRSNSDQDWRERTRGLLEVDEMDAISSSVRVLQM